MIHANRKFESRFQLVEESVTKGKGEFNAYLRRIRSVLATSQTKTKGINIMRLDKYLKVLRLIKRRTLAKEVADQGRITINDKVSKASSV